MWRTCSGALIAVALAGCSDPAARNQAFSANWDNARQDADIESLKRQMADLQKQDELNDKMLGDLQQQAANLQSQVNSNAKIANDNGKLDDRRWQYVRQRLPR